jgi:hypothetical protein
MTTQKTGLGFGLGKAGVCGPDSIAWGWHAVSVDVVVVCPCQIVANVEKKATGKESRGC